MQGGTKHNKECLCKLEAPNAFAWRIRVRRLGKIQNSESVVLMSIRIVISRSKSVTMVLVVVEKVTSAGKAPR